MSQPSPVVIIGGGIAGLAAAARIVRSDLPVILLEARDRLGGRILTHHDPACDTPIELGAEFIHGLPHEILDSLRNSGVTVTEVEGQSWCVSAGKLAPCDFFSEVDEILESMDDSQPDESFLSFMERCFPNPSRGSRLAEAKDWATDYVSGFNAADPNLVGVHWLVAGIRAEEKNQGHRAFRSRNGYQDLLDFFEQQIAKANTSIHTETVVRRINWKPGIAEIEASTKDGSLRLKASHVLVTLPVSLLKLPGEIGAVEFVPPLPKEKIDALQKIEMGKVIRIVLRFRNRFWETISPDNNISHKKKNLTNMSFLFTEDEVFPTWWTAAPSTEPIITGWAPFRAGEILSGQPESYITQRALAALSKAVGVGVERLESWLAASYVHDWQTDPFSRGAYSYGKVGAVEAQQALSRSVEDTLFFAGEATDTSGSNGTVHGAIASGYRAAAEIIRSARR